VPDQEWDRVSELVQVPDQEWVRVGESEVSLEVSFCHRLLEDVETSSFPRAQVALRLERVGFPGLNEGAWVSPMGAFSGLFCPLFPVCLCLVHAGGLESRQVVPTGLAHLARQSRVLPDPQGPGRDRQDARALLREELEGGDQ